MKRRRLLTSNRRLLRRVVLRNYKSIAACDISPAQLSFLVGPPIQRSRVEPVGLIYLWPETN